MGFGFGFVVFVVFFFFFFVIIIPQKLLISPCVSSRPPSNVSCVAF